jgi:hypothetical protein
MAKLTKAQVKLVRTAEQILVHQSLGRRFSGPTNFGDFQGLANFVREAKLQKILDEGLEIAGNALENVGVNLAAAHAAAADIRVEEPSTVDDFLAKLLAVHWQIQADQRFRVASQIAGSLANTIQSRTG